MLIQPGVGRVTQQDIKLVLISIVKTCCYIIKDEYTDEHRGLFYLGRITHVFGPIIRDSDE